MRGTHRRPSHRSAAVLLALVLTAAGLVALSVRGLASTAANPASPYDTSPVEGRIAYGGTLHRSIGVVDPVNTTASTPLFPGPQHYDDEVSAQGDAMVFTSLRDDDIPQVWLRGGDGSFTEITRNVSAVQHPVLSPDGRRIAFAASAKGGAGTPHDIWVVNSDGSGLRRVTDSKADNTWPTWSPDGTSIAFSGNRGSDGSWQIYQVPAVGGAVQQLTHTPVDPGAGPDPVGDLEPSWDPVAAHHRLIFTSVRYLSAMPAGPLPKIQQLAVLTAAGEEQPLGTFGAHSGSWSPDGSTVAFAGSAPGGASPVDRIYTVRVDGGAPQQPQLRLSEDRQLADPTWYAPAQGAPELLVTRDSAATVNTVDVADSLRDGNDPRDLLLPARDLVVDRGIGDESQRYSPDGRRLAYTRTEQYLDYRISRVWIADADGSGPHLLADDAHQNGESDTYPAWSPDGTRIALTRSGVPGRPGSSISVLDVATDHQLFALPSPDEQSDARPSFSPDGSTIAFTRTNLRTDVRATHIWAAQASDGTGQRDLTAVEDPGGARRSDSAPVYSPDGHTLAFVTDRAIGLMDPDGHHARTVFPTPDGTCPCLNPAWSADGTRFLVNAQLATGHYYLDEIHLATGSGGVDTSPPPPEPFWHRTQEASPSWQPVANLGTALVTPPRATTVGGSTSLVLSVTNTGLVDDPAAQLTLAVPDGLRLTGLTPLPPLTPLAPTSGSCRPALFQCDLGRLAVKETVQVRADLTATAPGTHPVGWTTTGSVFDPDLSDNHAEAPVAVGTPTPTPSPTVTPTATLPPDAALGIAAAPESAYVGGAVTVTYTVTNRGGRRATGLRLLPALAAGVTVPQWPAGCDPVGGCGIGDLAPGASAVARLVAVPTVAGSLDLSGTVTTTGSDAAQADKRAQLTLQVRQPGIVAVPQVGEPGFVTSIRGHDFPPGVPVTLVWRPGITATAAPVVPAADGSFTAQLLILGGDQLGGRTVIASGAGFAPVSAPFLVVPPVWGPPLFLRGGHA